MALLTIQTQCSNDSYQNDSPGSTRLVLVLRTVAPDPCRNAKGGLTYISPGSSGRDAGGGQQHVTAPALITTSYNVLHRPGLPFGYPLSLQPFIKTPARHHAHEPSAHYQGPNCERQGASLGRIIFRLTMSTCCHPTRTVSICHTGALLMIDHIFRHPRSHKLS